MNDITSADIEALKRILAKLEGTVPVYKTKVIKCPDCNGTGDAGNGWISDDCERCDGLGKLRRKYKVTK